MQGFNPIGSELFWLNATIFSHRGIPLKERQLLESAVFCAALPFSLSTVYIHIITYQMEGNNYLYLMI